MNLIPSFTGRACLLAAAASSLLLVSAASAASVKSYRYYRFLPNRLRDNPSVANSCSLSEFNFLLGGGQVSVNNVTVTDPAGDTRDPETPPKLVDGDLTTKWLDFNKLTALIFDFGQVTNIDSYNFATSNDAPERDPISWTFSGSNDGTNWTPLDIENNVAVTVARETYQTPFALPASLNPVVTTFASDATVILNGETPTLSWEVDLADTVTLNQGLGTVAATGMRTVTPPANAITTYTITGTSNATGVSTSASVPIKSVAGGEVTYRYVRFTPVKLRNPSLTSAVQIAGITFMDKGGAVSYPQGATATNPGGSNTPDAGEGALKAIDNDPTTKWYDGNDQPLIIDFSSPQTFDGYVITTANDTVDRDPVRWYLEGSADGTTWAPIDDMSQFDFPIPADREVQTQDIPIPGASVAPFILSLTADAPTAVAGQPVVLTWSSLYGSTASIDHSVGTVPVSGSVTVTPTATTTYTLSVTKAGGGVATLPITINVINPTNTTINYPTFDNAGSEIITLQDASVVLDPTRTLPGAFKRLRITEDLGSKLGAAWFAKRVDLSQGFDTTFDLSFITLNTLNNSGADGIAFMIQNNGNSLIPSPTEDKGFTQKSFAIDFDSYINTPEPSAATVQILSNKTLMKTVNLPVDFPAVLGANVTDLSQNTAGAAPYHVRVTYGSGKLNVYMNNTQIVTDYVIDLSGALDSSGKAYVGFVGRTGGQYEAHDVTSWTLTSGGPAGALAVTASTLNAAAGTGSFTWSSTAGKTYRVTTSPDLVTWTSLKTAIAATGNSTTSSFTFTPGAKGFFRIEQE